MTVLQVSGIDSPLTADLASDLDGTSTKPVIDPTKPVIVQIITENIIQQHQSQHIPQPEDFLQTAQSLLQQQEQQLQQQQHLQEQQLQQQHQFEQLQQQVAGISTLETTEFADSNFGYRCNECVMTFSTQSSLNQHKKMKHRDRTFQCSFCNKAYVKKADLNRHITCYHTKPGAFICPHCNKRFNRKDFLTKHVKRYHNNDERAFQCPHCDKTFKDKCSLSTHVHGIHNEKRRYVCDFCGMQTSWKSTYLKHVVIHQKNLP